MKSAKPWKRKRYEFSSAQLAAIERVQRLLDGFDRRDREIPKSVHPAGRVDNGREFNSAIRTSSREEAATRT